MIKNPKLPLAMLALAAPAVSASAQQVINYDFNVSAADVTAKFSNPGPTQNTVNWFGIGGIANSGYVNNNGTQPSLVYNTAVSTAAITTFNTSVFLRTGTVTNTGSGSSFMHLGFTDNLGANLRSDEAVSNFFALRFVGGAGAGELSWNTRTATPAGSSVNAPVSGASNFSLASDTWYKFDATFAKGAENIWNFTASITSYGSNGTTLGSVVSSASGSFAAQVGTYTASNLYGAVMWRGGFGANFGSADNYSIVTSAIPEPSAFAALAGLGALGLVATRRRVRR